MVDWFYVARNALWILGASVILAAFSYAGWWADRRGLSVREVLVRGSFAVACEAGLFLICLGLGAGATPLWERAFWLVLALALAWASAAAWRKTSKGAKLG